VAFTKQHKRKLLAEYQKWMSDSKAVFMLDFTKMSMKDVDALRARIREAGSKTHIIKNTLMDLALTEAGYKTTKLAGTSLCGFATGDLAALAKIFIETTKNSQIFSLKVGFMDGRVLTPADIKALAELPPLPVIRAQLLGVFNAPASRLVRTLAEPARSLAAVIKAHAEKVPAAA
jgi:large subunit ribosomal protein L10